MKFLCTYTDIPSKMFTKGKMYVGFLEKEPMPGNIAWHVKDDLGHIRILLAEKKCRFIINNPCSIFNDRRIPDYAHFDFVRS